MNTLDHSPESQLLQSFLDGDLDPYDEQTLFAALALNADLRMELREYMLIGNLAHADADRMAPSSALYERIAGSLGIADAIVPAQAAEDRRRSRRPHPIPLMFASAVAGALLMLWFISATAPAGPGPKPVPAAARVEPGTTPRAGRNDRAFTTGPRRETGMIAYTRNAAAAAGTEGYDTHGTPRVLGTPALGVDVSGPDAMAHQAQHDERDAVTPRIRRDRRRSTHTGTAIGDPAIDRRLGSSGTTDAIGETPGAVVAAMPEILPTAPRTTMNPATLGARAATPTAPRLRPNTSPAAFASAADMEERFAATLRGFQSVAYPSNGLKAPFGPIFNNMAVAVEYALSTTDAVGIEVGQETFPQTYTGVENDRTVEYRQRPLLTWSTIRYRNDALPLSGRFSGFWSVGLGGTVVGPIARSEVGIEYGAGNGISLVAGIDATVLAYRFNANWFNTRRLAFSYGARVRF